MIVMMGLCLVSTMAFWLTATLISGTRQEKSLLITFALVFGFSSGSNNSLGPVCAGQFCTTENYGKFFATCYTVGGLGTLVVIPIAGTILRSGTGSYSALAAFISASYLIGLGLLIWARIRKVGWSLVKEAKY